MRCHGLGHCDSDVGVGDRSGDVGTRGVVGVGVGLGERGIGD